MRLDYRNRKSRNASRMTAGNALSSRLKPLDNRNPIHPSCSTLIAWLGQAVKAVILQNKQELKHFQRAVRTRDKREKCGGIGSRFAFLDLRRFAVSLEMPTDKTKNLLFSDRAE